MCIYCKRRERRVGSSTCSEACAERRRQVNAAYRERIATAHGRTVKHYKKRSAQDSEPVKGKRKHLSDAELLAHYNASKAKHNAAQRELYRVVKPHCERCGATLLLCECPPIDAREPIKPHTVVEVLNVATMRKHVEII